MACRYRLKKCERCFVSFYLSMVKKALSKSGVSPKQLGLIAYFFLHVRIESMKVKGDLKVFSREFNFF